MADPRTRFPDFCRPGNLFSVFLIAELIVLLPALAPANLHRFEGRAFALASLFVQLVALWNAGLLCVLRPRFERLTGITAYGLAYLLILGVTAAATAFAHWLDRLLALGSPLSPLTLADALVGNLAITALVAAAALRYFQVQMAWRRQIEAAADARLQALQARIRPHFLFNALNSIASLTRRDPAAAERAVEDLSDLFRATLDRRGGAWRLRDEIAACERYIAIEQLRLGERLTVAWELDALPDDLPLPALSVQPLVENAIQHGIQLIREGGTVRVSGGLSEDGTQARLTVRNPVPRDGRGQRGGAGQAVENIRQRFMLRFGPRGTLLTERGPSAFEATLSWPVHAAASGESQG